MRSESLRMALQVLVRNPGRSALTVLGLAIGVAAFIAMVAFGEGARRAVLLQFSNLGANMLRVRQKATAADFVTKPARPLSDRDVSELRRETTTLAIVVPHIRRFADIVSGSQRVRSTLIGTEPDYAVLHGWQADGGGMFDARDLRESAKVLVLGNSVAERLFGDEDPLGRVVTIAGSVPCRIVGVLASRGRSIGGGDLDDFVLMPATTYAQHLGMQSYVHIEMQPMQAGWLEEARGEADAVLRRTHGFDSTEAADFDIVSPDDVTRAADQTARILTGLLAGIAAVSLLVGGIGIMNIQLVAVAERTHEIGIRAAIGASPAQIRKQFLVESAVLAAVGVLIGVAIGVGLAQVVAHAMAWPQAVSVGAVVLSGLFGVSVGVVFGFVPAVRAAQLDPIIALRRE
jgi:putative ABC transport system permease protein